MFLFIGTVSEFKELGIRLNESVQPPPPIPRQEPTQQPEDTPQPTTWETKPKYLAIVDSIRELGGEAGNWVSRERIIHFLQKHGVEVSLISMHPRNKAFFGNSALRKAAIRIETSNPDAGQTISYRILPDGQ